MTLLRRGVATRVCVALWATVVMGNAALVACSGNAVREAKPEEKRDASAPDAAVAPALFNPVDVPNEELAVAALSLLGHHAFTNQEMACGRCHGMSRELLDKWRLLTDVALTNCFTDLNVATPESARAMIDCLRPNGTPDASFAGIFSAAAHLPWFKFAFERMLGDTYQVGLSEFIAQAGMPFGAGHKPYTQAEFDVVATWFIRGLPALQSVIPPDSRPDECLPHVSADVASHVAAMSIGGWRARNLEASLLMHGCANRAAVRDCLDEYPRAQDKPLGSGWGQVLPGHVDRVLFRTDYASAFWTKSSADGRYVAHGRGMPQGGDEGAIIDLAAQGGGIVIGAAANYDPSFFPDNSGFIMHGTSAFVCDQRVLAGPPLRLNFTEPGCVRSKDIGLYEHGAVSLDGADYWVIDGAFQSDDGGHQITLGDPPASFELGSSLWFTRLRYTGVTYEAGERSSIVTPYEGDGVLSPSGQLIASRLGGADRRQLGFVLRRVASSNTAPVSAPEVARYCVTGGKPSFSFDERWMVYHHYIEPNSERDALALGFGVVDDPGFAEYARLGTANVFAIELATGAVTQLTHMSPGQYALFPHFRSDGWVYYMVRSVGRPQEHLVATDAVLTLETASP